MRMSNPDPNPTDTPGRAGREPNRIVRPRGAQIGKVSPAQSVEDRQTRKRHKRCAHTFMSALSIASRQSPKCQALQWIAVASIDGSNFVTCPDAAHSAASYWPAAPSQMRCW